jgi:hypothetical protein
VTGALRTTVDHEQIFHAHLVDARLDQAPLANG